MTNLLRPNFYGIETVLTPQWVVSNGMVAKVTDSAGDQTIVIAQGGKLDLDGAVGGNIIVFQGLLASQVSVYRFGGEARFRLFETGETILSMPVSASAQTIRFADADRVLTVSPTTGAMTYDGAVVSQDSSPPALVSAGVAGSVLSLVFSEELNASGLPLTSSLLVTVNGSAVDGTQLSVLDAEGVVLRVQLPASAATATAVSVAYADPTTGNDSRAIQDVNGNDALSFSSFSAVINPVDGRAPVLVAASTSSNGSRIFLDFDETLASSTAGAGQFAVSIDGVAAGVAATSAAGQRLELSLSAPVQAGQQVRVSYSDPSGQNDAAALQDAAGNDVASWSNWIVGNEVSGAAPVLAQPTNILRPNFYGIETSTTPSWKVSAGLVAKVTDADGVQTIVVAQGGKLDLDGASGANVIVLEGLQASDVEAYRFGGEARFRLKSSGETILSLPAGADAQTIRFVDGDRLLRVVGNKLQFADVDIAQDSTPPVCEKATIDQTELRLVFSEELDGAKLPPASALKITVAGQLLTASQFTIQGVEGKHLVITLSQAVVSGTMVTVGYTDPSGGNDSLAIQDINGNDAATFAAIQAVEPIVRVALDDQADRGTATSPALFDVSAQAFLLIEDLSRPDNFEIEGFGADDQIELNNLASPSQLTINNLGADIELIVNAGGGVTSRLLITGVADESAIINNPAAFNDLAVGNLIGVDTNRPVFSGGAARTVSVTEGGSVLTTVSASDASGVSYSISGTDASLLQVGASSGVVSLKTGLLDFDAADAKKVYSFEIVANDPFRNSSVQAVTVNVTNDSADDGPTADTAAPILQAAAVSSDGRTITLTFSEALDIAAPTLSQMPQRFTVTAGLASNWPIESVSISGNVVVLTTPDNAPIPRPASLNPSTVTVGYTDLTAADDTTGVLQDYPAGNDVATFSGFAAQNNSTFFPTPPTLTIEGLTGGNTVYEGSSNTYTVTLSDYAGAGGFVVDWRVVPHSPGDPAEAGDFGASAALATFPSGSITVPQGSKTGQIVVSIFDDALEEGDEVFDLQVGKIGTGGEFTMALEHWTMIYASDSGGGTPEDFCSIDPATEYAGYVTAAGADLVTALPSAMTRQVSIPVEKDGFIGSVTAYGTNYVDTVDDFIAAAGSTYGFLLQDFEALAPGNFAGASSTYEPAAGSTRADSTGDLSAGTGSGTLLIDGLMAIKLFNTSGSVGAGADSPGDDPGIATNPGNDADRGYNQTEDGNLYLEVLPGNSASGGVLFCFDPLETPVYGFGFHLMGREDDKRDVYLDVHLSDGTIYRELTGTNTNGTGGQQFYSFTIDPSAGSIEGFVLYEPWAAESADERDIFAIDDLALVVAGKTDALTGDEYREVILGRGDAGGGSATTAVTVAYERQLALDDLVNATIFGDGDAQVSPTQITIDSSDGTKQARLTGNGLIWTDSGDGGFELTGGTITSAQFFDTESGSISLAVTFQGLSLDAVALNNAVEAVFDSDLTDFSAYDALFTAYRYDITGSTGNDLLEGNQFDDTLRGGGGADTLRGWEGDDLLIPSANIGGVISLVEPGIGNDTIDFRQATTGDQFLSYEGLGGAVGVTIDGASATGSVAKGTDSALGADTVLGLSKFLTLAMNTSVLGSGQVRGSAYGDTFDVHLVDGQWISLRGLAGPDVFDLSGSGWIRLDYIDSPNGVNVDLADGKAYSDGYGSQDTITGKVNELRGSNATDQLTGSAEDESFIPRKGNDIIDGGGGFDRLRYDQGNVTGLEVDLLSGEATGYQDGAAFTHQITGIEWVRGSNNADRLLSGTGSVRLEGLDGADVYGIDNGGTVRIDDYEIGTDVLDVSDLGLTQQQAQDAMADAVATTVSGVGSARVTFNASTSVTFYGLSTSQVASITPNVQGTASTDTTPPTNTGATFSVPSTPDGTVTVTLRFSEAIVEPTSWPTLYAYDPSLGYTQYVSLSELTLDSTGTTLTVTGDLPYGMSTLADTDFMTVSFYANAIRDLVGNAMPAREVWFGGNGANTLDVRYYQPYGNDPPQIHLRGNGGNDQLLGNDSSNTLLDGSGSDTLVGGGGSDTIVLTESLTGTMYRDVVIVRPGDSPVGTTTRDQIQPAASNPTGSGFDITSSNALLHDVLELPSNLILADTSAQVDGTNVANFSRHSVQDGVVTLADEAGTAISVNGVNAVDAVNYLRANIDGAGLTAALRLDRDSNGSVDSLIVFQDGGRLATKGDAEAPETLVVIRDLVGAGSATLGTAPGMNVVEIGDDQGPVSLHHLKTATGFQIDFNEAVFFDQETLRLRLWKNGFDDASELDFQMSGNGTQTIAIDLGTTLGDGDWLFGWHEPDSGDASTGISDANGNLEQDEYGEVAGDGYWAEGDDAAETIDLADFIDGGVDIDGFGGNDRLIGTQSPDHIYGGKGSDTMTGGDGPDFFGFDPGDAPVIERAQGSASNPPSAFVIADGEQVSFPAGPEIITDLGGGDSIWINGLSYGGGSSGGDVTSLMEGGRALVQGSFNSTSGVFTVDSDQGLDTLLLFDADPVEFNQVTNWTGVVLQGITPDGFEMSSGGYLQTKVAPTVDQALTELSNELSFLGYQSAVSVDVLYPEASLLSIENVQVEPGTGILTFDLALDPNDPDVQALDPLAVMVQFGGDLEGVLEATALPIAWQYGGQNVPMWTFNDTELAEYGRLYASPYGVAELATDPQIYEQNPLMDSAGRIGRVRVELEGSVSEVPLITVEELVVFPIDWLTGPAPLLVVDVADPAQVLITSSDDNLLKFAAIYDETNDETHLTAMFDEDPDLDQIQPSQLIELTFPGDVTSSLVPESLTFSG